MRNIFSILWILLLFSSCKGKKDDLELILLNNVVFCAKNVHLLEKNNTIDYFNDKNYDSLSRNIVNYKLINNSDKKYFIVLNENDVDSMENDYLFEKLVKNRLGQESGFSLNLFKNTSILTGRTSLISVCANYETELEYCKSKLQMQNYIDSLFIDNIKKRKLYNTKYPSIIFRDVLLHSFVLHPGETKYFTSVVHLPYRKEAYWLSFVDSTKPNLASVALVNISKSTEENLSINQKKEIKENGYTIFNGIIQSNKVPVIMVKMPEN